MTAIKTATRRIALASSEVAYDGRKDSRKRAVRASRRAEKALIEEALAA